MVGVSVLEKGTSNGTITDIDGNFSLSVSEGSILEISDQRKNLRDSLIKHKF